MAPGTAAAVSAGAWGLSGKQQPHALWRAEGSGWAAGTPSPSPSEFPSPSSPSPSPAVLQGEHPAAGDGDSALSVSLPTSPASPPKVPSKIQTLCRQPSPARAPGFLMQCLVRQSCRRATKTLRLLCWGGETRGETRGATRGALTQGGPWPSSCASSGGRGVGGAQPGEILVLIFQPNPS